MACAVSCCFQEDAACVIIDEEVVLRLAPAGADGPTQTSLEESCELDDLVLFLGRALLLTRRVLYVLLCVPPEARTPPFPVPSNEQCSHGHRFGDAANFVSCGRQTWHLIVCLNTRVGSLARRLGLSAAPVIIPWECEESGEQDPAGGLTRTLWVKRAREAVLHHYRQTVGGKFFWEYADEAAHANAVPLILDSASAFTSRAPCGLWPRHCHVRHLGGSVQVASSEQVLLFEVEVHDLSRSQPSAPFDVENLRGMDAHLTSQGFRDVVGRRDIASSSEKVKTQAPFGYTLVAGTFDRLHAGHHLLLAAAALSARQRVGLGVASGPLVTKKTASQEDVTASGVEPFGCRLRAAAAFLQLLAASTGRAMRLTGFREALEEEEASLSDSLQLQFPLLGGSNEFSHGFMPVMEASSSTLTGGLDLHVHVFRITNAIGPSDRLAFDCLVVSSETMKGAKTVNRVRIEAGNEPVFVLTVGLVPADAFVVRQAAETLAVCLPRPLFTRMYQSEQEYGFSRLDGDEALSNSSIVATKQEGQPSASQEHQNSTDPVDALRNKLSSTALREQQQRLLCCGCIVELCKRFQAAWRWLEGREGETGITVRQRCATMWSVLCAAHAAPWRRVHTFDRVARALRQLDASSTSLSREPIVLGVFLGSLLACPCHYVSLTRRACAASDSRGKAMAEEANSCTVASWSPEAEDALWLRAAAKLLAGLQCMLKGQPCAAAQNGKQATGWVSTASTVVCGDVVLEGHFSLLLGLLLEQRAASLTRLPSVVQAVHALRGQRPAAWDGGETGKFMRLARRLEQLELTDGSVDESTRLGRVRQEYFFVSEDCFSRYRMKQLAQLLDSASGIDCLSDEEILRARESLERELDILASR